MFLHLSVILFTWGTGCVQERWSLKQAVRILLECILVSNMSVKKMYGSRLSSFLSLAFARFAEILQNCVAHQVFGECAR